MRLSHLVYAAAGYVLGTKAGRERYEQIVRVARRVGGSQTVQSTAGVVQAQLDRSTAQARQIISARFGGTPTQGTPVHSGVNGHNGANGYHH